MDKLILEILKCEVCLPYLPLGPKPIFAAHPKSKIVIIGQAPGTKVHKSGIPWEDKSGDNLRAWMQVDKITFYSPEKIALVPMGFCYPGKGQSGDLPPRKECAPLWHHSLLQQMKEIQLTLLIGKYAQEYYLHDKTKQTLTETVKNFEEYLPHYFVLPHPSPRNNIWQAKNQWFMKEVIPKLQTKVKAVL